LFIKYQIPSDLLSYSDDLLHPGESATAEKRLELVKGQVQAMLSMIEVEKQAEIVERRQEEEHRRLVRMEEKRRRRKCKESEKEEISIAHVELTNVRKQRSAGSRAKGLLGGFGGMMKGGLAALTGERYAKVAKGGEIEIDVEKMDELDDAMDDGEMDVDEVDDYMAEECSLAEAANAEGDAATAPKAPPKPHRQVGSGQAHAIARDYTRVAKQMDEQFEKLDPDSSLRPTIITPGSTWKMTSQPKLLAAKKTEDLGADGQQRLKMEAFELLDSITKSGALPLSHATLHIVVAATHCFDKTVTETVIQENMNPIEKVERSSLIMASTVHQQAVSALMNDTHCARVLAHSPQLEDVSEKAVK